MMWRNLEEDREERDARGGEVLRGSLDDFALEDILWLIDHSHNTGELEVRRPDGAGRFFFSDGGIYCAEAEFLRESLASQLLRTAAVEQEQLEEATKITQTAGERLGDALLSSGAIGEEELAAAFKDRVESASFELLRRSNGEFNWEPDVKAEPEFTLSISVEDLMASMKARFKELDEVRKVIPSGDSIPVISTAPPTGMKEIRLSVDQWRLVGLIDGATSFEDIARRAQLGDLTVLKTLHPLASRGLLEVFRPEELATSFDRVAPPAPPVTDTKTFNIVLVCTGNRVRSPMGEAFLRDALRGLPVSLGSVGIEDWGPQPAIPEAVAAARELGGDLSTHRARPITGVDLGQADLVIGFERVHVSRSLGAANASPEKTFTMIELTEYLRDVNVPEGVDPVTRARAVVEQLPEIRSRRGLTTRDIDLTDPLGGPPGAYRETAMRVKELCRKVAQGMFGVSG
jgi:protein-tyrosine-phosphatase